MRKNCLPCIAELLRLIVEPLNFKRKSITLTFLFLIVALPVNFLQAQTTVIPKIKTSKLYDDQLLQKEEGVVRYGVEIFGSGTYKDSLINYIDTIIDLHRNDGSLYDRYQAVWRKDTLTYRVRPQVCRTETYDYEQKKKVQILEVESQLPPYTCFSVETEGLEESTIQILKDSMLRMRSDSPVAFNNDQTCIFYALEGIFRTNQVDPRPIITRNTNFCEPKELNAFFDYFFVAESKYDCRWKALKKVSLPNNCILAFLNDYNEIIHAVFYHDNLFYTKNGLFVPAVYSSLKPILKHYSRWDGEVSELNKTGKRLQGHSIIIYTLSKALFKKALTKNTL